MDVEDVRPAKVKRLEVPEEIRNMFQVEESRTSRNDDASDHEGRIRSFPHVRGNWASHIYVPCSDDALESIQVMQDLVEAAWTSKELVLNLIPLPHLSLSKTVVFRHHWLEEFKSDLKLKLSAVTSFYSAYDCFDVLVNEEETRTFLVMKLVRSNRLLDLVNACDDALKQYKLESYYEDPSFHISLGWFLGCHLEKVKDCLPLLNAEWMSLVEEDDTLGSFSVSAVEFKYGNKLATFNL